MVNELPVRKHPRLKDYDYSQSGAYFITFCVKDRHEILGKVVVGRGILDAPHPSGILDAPHVELSEYGKIVVDSIEFLNNAANEIAVDKYVVMPNHVHLIIICKPKDGASGGHGDGASGKPRPTNAVIPKFVSSVKRYTNKRVDFSMWQDSYHDRIIRNETEYLRIWQYIDENPAKWQDDCYYA